MAQAPPRYVLLSTTSLSTNGPSRSADVSPFVHPASISYQYADDPPLQLLPLGLDTLIVMDVDEISVDSTPAVRSLSEGVVVTGVRVSEVPGASIAPSLALEDVAANPNMYVIELSARPTKDQMRLPDEVEMIDHGFIARFKQKNDYLRRVLEYSDLAHQLPISSTDASALNITSTSSLSPPPEPSEAT